jgi:uncharacterized protein (DUF2062 family)/SAM-dependent methyltransferase
MGAFRARLHALIKELLREHRAPARVAAAIVVGAIVGCTPLFGLHIVVCVLLSMLLGLNLVIVYAAANLSMPPMIPFVGFASVQLGERVLHGRFLALDHHVFRDEPLRALVHRFFASWMVGGVLLGAAIGGLGALVAWGILRGRTPVVDPIADAIERARHRYDGEPGRLKWYARMKYVMDPCYRAIAPRIPAGSLTVDLGTGLGMLPVLLGLLGQERRALGIEWDAVKAAAGARAAAGLSGIEVVAGDARDTALPACDVITIVDVLHYYDAEAQRALLARCKAALRPGGRLLIREGDGARGGGSRMTRWFEQVVTRLGWNRGPQVRFRPIAELEGDLGALGFAVSRDEVAGAMHPGNVLLEARLQ